MSAIATAEPRLSNDLLDPDWLRARLLALRDREVDTFEHAPPPPGFRPSAVLIPLWNDGGRVRTVLAMRPQTMRSHQGQIAFPGGRVEPDDLTLLDTALREANEEVGIERGAVELVVPLDHTWSIQRYLVSPWVAWLREPPQLQPAPDEVERMIVVDFAKLLEESAYSAQPIERAGLRATMHQYTVDGDRVWGLTGGIIYSLIATLRGIPLDEDSRGPETLRRFAGLFE